MCTPAYTSLTKYSPHSEVLNSWARIRVQHPITTKPWSKSPSALLRFLNETNVPARTHPFNIVHSIDVHVTAEPKGGSSDKLQGML